MIAVTVFVTTCSSRGAQLTCAGQAAQLDIRAAGAHSIRVTLKPSTFADAFPFFPALAERVYAYPVISLREIGKPVQGQVGNLNVEVRGDPLRVIVKNAAGQTIQDVAFLDQGKLTFKTGYQPILGLGEGGPQPGRNWRDHQVEYDRRGRVHAMRPRWQSNAYGSRNPVALMIGTDGWGLFIATPWGQIDLRDKERASFRPGPPPPGRAAASTDSERERSAQRSRYTAQVQGRPPVDGIVPGVYDLFIFDAHDPAHLMQDLSVISGPAVLPPKWSLGYMQSHRTLEDENQMIDIVKTFRAKRLPLDAVIYLGTGFCPRGWNTKQPSFDFNPEVFLSDPAQVIETLHDLDVKVLVHMVPWRRDRLPTLQGTIPALPGETVDRTHILDYWRQHVDLVKAGIDAWWPDEGDWFNLFERIKRHQLYYQGPLSTRPSIRPWSLHRNGHLGIAQWGGWVWSGDTDSSWKTLEAQIVVGINHSLSLSPFWGSDIGGFYPNEALTGELYARWFQFAAFCPSFRAHGRTWWTRLPWGWGLKEMGPRENRNNPRASELNNPAIEPICRQFSELRYQLMPYTYTLAWQARTRGMPLMRAMWLHYPEDENVHGLGSQYLWGRDMLVAPVFAPGASTRDVYLPAGQWYDWWTNAEEVGAQTITRTVNLSKIPIYVRAGAIIPFDPVRQYTGQKVDEPTTIRVYGGANGQFTLYEDDGISLDYLKGHATRTRMTWDDNEQCLILEPSAPDGAAIQISKRVFKIELLPEGTAKRVNYNGRYTTVSFK